MPKIPEKKKARVYWEDHGVQLWLGHVLDALALMSEKSVHMCVTSPPYWGLRAYLPDGHEHKAFELGSEPSPDCGTQGRAQCGRCFVCNMVAVFRAVRRVLRDDATLWLNLGDTYSGGKTGRDDKQTGGGLYNGKQEGYEPIKGRGPAATEGLPSGNLVGAPWRVALALQADGWILRQEIIWVKPAPMPESVRNRCTKAHEHVFLFAKGKGYFYDAEAIRETAKSEWATESFLPDSEKDRNGDARMAAVGASRANRSPDLVTTGANKRDVWEADDHRALIDWLAANDPDALARFFEEARGRGDAWRIASAGYPGAHFATFPPKLIEPMLLAGTSARGCCEACGAPWQRIEERKFVGSYHDHTRDGVQHGLRQRGEGGGGPAPSWVPPKTLGWEPACECNGRFEESEEWVERPKSLEKNVGDHEKKAQTQGDLTRSTQRAPKLGERDRSLPQNRNGITGSLDGAERETERIKVSVRRYVPNMSIEDHPTVPAVVLDPFMGSGTTGAVCIALGRRAVGVDLSEKYLRENAVPRIRKAALELPGAQAATKPATGKVVLGGRSATG